MDKLLDKLTNFAIIVMFLVLAVFAVCLWLLGFALIALVALLFEYWLGIPEGQGSWLGLILGAGYMVGTIFVAAWFKQRFRKVEIDNPEEAGL
jgi:hypothetical protein